MEYAALFTASAREGLLLRDYSLRFSQLAHRTAFNDETLKSLYWIGANYHRPEELPDIKKDTWREAVLRCLESVYPQITTPSMPPSPEPS